MDKELRNKLLGQAHQLCAKLGMDEDERRSMLASSFGTPTMATLKYGELLKLVDKLQRLVDARKTETDEKYIHELDQARKRLIAAIGAYLRENKQNENIDTIKAIACRAAKVDRFNEIALADLKCLSATFRAKARTAKQNEIKRIAMLN